MGERESRSGRLGEPVGIRSGRHFELTFTDADADDLTSFLRPEFRDRPAVELTSGELAGDPRLAAVANGEGVIDASTPAATVKRVQRALAELGEQVKPDGDYGSKTRAAVENLQRRAGLAVTGEVDADTIKAMELRLRLPEDERSLFDRPADPPPAPVADRGAPSEPSPTDVGWFTDADELEAPASVRRYLDRALREGGEAVMALRLIDLNMATPEEKARLIEHLLDGHTAGPEEKWILDRLGRDRAEGAAIINALAGRGRLGQVFADFHGANYQKLLGVARNLSTDAETAANVAAGIGVGSGDDEKLAIHKVFDQARAGGYLDATLAKLDGKGGVVGELAKLAKPIVKPDVIAHRGLPTTCPENTMPAIEAAVAAGADGVEIDLTPTRDGHIVLWHDYSPAGLVAIIRNLGLEGGMGFRPILPELGHSARAPVYQLDLATFRRHYGYVERSAPVGTSQRAHVEIPTFETFAAYARSCPQLKTIVLDIKLPADQPTLTRRFGRRLAAQIREYGLASRVVVLHNTAGVVKTLKQAMGDDFAYSHDVEIVAAIPNADSYSAVEAADRLGNRVASVGRPRIGIGAYQTYIKVLTRDRQRLQRSPNICRRLLTWTLNDELELREVIGIGVDGILTDDPALLRRLVRTYWP